MLFNGSHAIFIDIHTLPKKDNNHFMHLKRNGSVHSVTRLTGIVEIVVFTRNTPLMMPKKKYLTFVPLWGNQFHEATSLIFATSHFASN